MKEKLLLHICCAPDAIVGLERLEKQFSLIGYFCNPNIEPFTEYKKRWEQADKLSFIKKVFIIEDDYNHNKWLNFIKGLENEEEGGLRCEKCYEFRLNKCAQFAKEKNINWFSTVLTISPHKNAEKINNIGKQIAKKYNLNFLETNLKKKDGFKESIYLSKLYNLYRQSYCGCEFGKK